MGLNVEIEIEVAATAGPWLKVPLLLEAKF
jgi:hypothetical protein